MVKDEKQVNPPEKKDSDTPPLMEVFHDESPAIVSDHKFSPMGEWYTRCRICKLAEAAHASSEKIEYVGDDDE